ncbi:MAG: TylF/MycF/NovP-related O-methyltransferase [bacterium]
MSTGSEWLMARYFTPLQRQMLIGTEDPVRYGTLLLSFEQISREGIAGSLAECGVYKGATSKFIHDLLPERKLFLFDTFEGFDGRDSEIPDIERFKDTSEQVVLDYIGNVENIIIQKGYFPETAAGLEKERFAFVLIDFDKYKPTMAALKVFYSRVNPGGFIFIHDYSNPESEWGCSRALNEFLSDKPEKPILIPDAWGTALFRKV